MRKTIKIDVKVRPAANNGVRIIRRVKSGHRITTTQKTFH